MASLDSSRTDCDSSVSHFRRLAELAEELKGRGIAIYDHHWESLNFGSFTVTAGSRRDCYEFSWDGREFFLSISRCGEISESKQVWQPVASHRLPPNGDRDPFVVIEEFFGSKHHP